jgi:hypothetical protein
MLLSPLVEGTATIGAPHEAFFHAFVRRINEGLLLTVPPSRNRYVVSHAGPEALRFHADGWPTAFNVGLNDVDVTAPSRGIVRYRIQYGRWTRSAVAMGAGFAMIFIGWLLLFDLRTYIAEHPGPEYLGLSPEQSVGLAWAMALFWGFVWPWVLVIGHKRPLRRLMESLIADVDVAAGGAAPRPRD